MKKSQDVFLKPMLKGSLTQFIVFCFDGKHAWKHTAAWTGYLLFFPPWEGLVIYVKVDGDKQQTLNKNPSDEFLVNVFLSNVTKP